MSDRLTTWWSLLRWRWGRDAGAEIARRAARRPVALGTADDVSRLTGQMRAIERAARWVPRSRCLDRALCLAEWADRSGIPAELCIGIRRVDANVRAHAWVHCGAAIIDPDPGSTAQFVRLDAGIQGLEFDR